MSRQIALFVCVGFILWLFARDRKKGIRPSVELWVPWLWLSVIGSRSVSAWFDGGKKLDSPDDYLDGSPMDRNFFLGLIVLGVVILARRRLRWDRIVPASIWLCVLFAYWLVSVAWSDYPFVGLKRWIKDVGNVIMVLVVLTDRNPLQALKCVLARCSYVLMPLSMLFIKYYPEYGRTYSQWTWEPYFVGVCLEKNALGCIGMVCTLSVVWGLMDEFSLPKRQRSRLDIAAKLILLLVTMWVTSKADSSTAFVCWILGAGILFVLRFRAIRLRLRHMEAYAIGAGLVALAVISMPELLSGMLGMMGEDAGLTGRTDLWKELLAEPINPLLGTGYQSYWLGERAAVIWEKYYFHPNQAHNGYLETYLNGGFIGVGLLLCLLVATARRIRDEVLAGDPLAPARLAFLVIGILYNWTEAVYNRLSPAWFIILLALIKCPQIKSPSKVPGSVPNRFKEHGANVENHSGYN